VNLDREVHMEVHTLEAAVFLSFVNLVILVNLFRGLLIHARARARMGVKKVHEVHEVHYRIDFPGGFAANLP
jgi:hypothetical protein